MNTNTRNRELAALDAVLDAQGKLGLHEAQAARSIWPASIPGDIAPPYDRRFSPRDYLAFLLYLTAEIEHALMDQYLYAAWSLGGPQVPPARVRQVQGWRQVVLGIAKEEMGHFVTMQNVLRVIGAPLNLGRDDYPWDVPFLPFRFELKPLTLDSLAMYVYAESPHGWTGGLADEIQKRVKKQSARPHRIEAIFDLMLKLIADETLIPDSAFHPSTLGVQASWDEWGRGYRDGARGNFNGVNPPGTPNLLVMAVQSRRDAVEALEQIAEQGEASSGPGPESHFVRFLQIYQEMKEVAGEGWSPSRNVAVNPSVGPPRDGPDAGTTIVNPVAWYWAELHNQRYRMLLTFLAHSFMLDGGLVSAFFHTARGTIVNATFGEMYNLRAIAGILVTLPVDVDSPMMAGPPMQMPYTLMLPDGEEERWQLHLDLIEASGRLIDTLMPMTAPEHVPYLVSLKTTDQRLVDIGSHIVKAAATAAAQP
jgi:hypothetical protein